ncbi:MAG: AarF/UbiB family protein [Dehalococcoidia bacterium]
MAAGMDDPQIGTEYRPPVAIGLPKPGWSAKANRFFGTFKAFAGHAAPAMARQLAQRARNDHATARAIRSAFEELGATYVKFGQFVGSAPDIVGDEAAREFRSCLDTGPAIPFRAVRSIVEEDLGQPLGEAFATFDETPLAAASIAVVHRATLHDGRAVAVKILRPGMDEVVATDLALLEAPVRFLASQGSDLAMTILGYLVGLREQIAEELDLRNEARSMVHFRRLFAELGLSRLEVPRPHEALSTRHVMTMDLLEGVAIDDLAGIKAMGVGSPEELVRDLFRAWILTAVRFRAFHADIHAGNLILMPDGRLGIVDWGIIARLDDETHQLLFSLIEAALGRDHAWDRIAEYIIGIQGASLRDGLGLSDDQIRRLVRVQLEPILTRPVGEVSMSSLFAGSEEAIVQATGEPPLKRSVVDRLRLLRKTRRANQLMLKQGTLDVGSQRAGFLAAKQLVYLERYWRMYLPDTPLMSDREFFERLLASHGAPS